MKRISLLLLLFMSFQVFAQQPKGKDKTPEQRAEAITNKLTKELTLTADQQPKVKAVALDRAQKVDAIKAKYANSKDKKAMHQELKAVKDSADKSIQALLTPEQLTRYKQLKAEKNNKAKAKKGKAAPNPQDDEDDE